MPLRTFQSRAHSPGSRENRSGRNVGIPASVASIDADLSGQCCDIRGTRLDQQCGAARPEQADVLGQAGFAFDGSQRRAVGEFDGSDGRGLQQRDRSTRGLEIIEEDERARLVRVVRDRGVGDFADESERAFGADHEMREDVERILEVDERVQAVARRVLQPELVADARRERRVAAHPTRHRVERTGKPGFALEERGAARGIARVEHRPAGKHDAQSGQRVVAVLRGAAAHPARVVGGDAADHCGIDGRRVGPDLAAETRQPAVRHRTDHTGLQGNGLRRGTDFAAPPVVPEHHQHRIGDRLTRKARARRAKRDRRARARAVAEQAHDVGLALDHDDDFRHQPIEAGVGAPGQQAQRVGDEPIFGYVRRREVAEPVVRRWQCPVRPPVTRRQHRSALAGTPISARPWP